MPGPHLPMCRRLDRLCRRAERASQVPKPWQQCLWSYHCVGSVGVGSPRDHGSSGVWAHLAVHGLRHRDPLKGRGGCCGIPESSRLAWPVRAQAGLSAELEGPVQLHVFLLLPSDQPHFPSTLGAPSLSWPYSLVSPLVWNWEGIILTILEPSVLLGECKWRAVRDQCAWPVLRSRTPFGTWVRTPQVHHKAHRPAHSVASGALLASPSPLASPVHLHGAWPAPASDSHCPSACVP